MSTLKIINLQHPSGANTNAVLDTNGNLAVTGNMQVGGSVSGSYNSTFRNRIINGDMRIDQRNAGASMTVTNASPYLVDRLIVGMSGANGTGQRVASTASGFPYQVTLTGTSSTTTTWFGQRIESYNCTDLVGQTVTVSFYAASSNLPSLLVGVFYANSTDNYGNGGNITQIGSNQTVNVTSTMTKYSVTFTALPSQVANGIYLQFIGNGNLGTGTISFTGIQLELGTIVTPFEFRPYGTELALCQRYYQKTYEIGTAPGTATHNGMYTFPIDGNGSTNYNYIQYIQPMRAAPTITMWDGAGNSNACSRYRGSWTDNITSSFSPATSYTTSWVLQYNGAPFGTGTPTYLHYSASAEL